MRIIHHTFDKLARLPWPIFNGICTIYSYPRHRQELFATATLAP
jgi:hypothetical protein